MIYAKSSSLETYRQEIEAEICALTSFPEIISMIYNTKLNLTDQKSLAFFAQQMMLRPNQATLFPILHELRKRPEKERRNATCINEIMNKLRYPRGDRSMIIHSISSALSRG